MKLKVLILDDDAIQLDIMSEYMSLSKIPNETNYFDASIKAIEYLNSCDSVNLPDVIFIDIFMPLLDGWETLKKLEPIILKRNWKPSIFVLTSSVSKLDTEKVDSQNNLKGFINKPINLKQLISILTNEYNQILAAE